MSDEIPQYAKDELAAFLIMDDKTLLQSYKLYLSGDWHIYSEYVLDNVKQELIARGLIE